MTCTVSISSRGGRGDSLRRLLRAGRGEATQTLQGPLLCGRQRPQARRRLRLGVHKEQAAGARMGGVATQSLPAALRRKDPRQKAEKTSPPTPRMVHPPQRGLRAFPPAARRGGARAPPPPAAGAQAQGQDVGWGERWRPRCARGDRCSNSARRSRSMWL